MYGGDFGNALSYILGWLYFTAWSVSFYPQAILDWRRKSVQGLSIDFIYYNVYGFSCYATFNLAFFFNKTIQKQYRDRNDGNDNLVRANDVFFAVHALCLSVVVMFQSLVYKRDHSQRSSRVARTVILGSMIICIFYYFIGDHELIDLMYFLSFIKLGISIIKYIPQAYVNFKRKSTVGWSIDNILLDITGGVLSIAQLLLDAYLANDWSGVVGDPVKFGLGFFSIAFDIVFMVQHYILYRDHNDYAQVQTDGERLPIANNKK